MKPRVMLGFPGQGSLKPFSSHYKSLYDNSLPARTCFDVYFHSFPSEFDSKNTIFQQPFALCAALAVLDGSNGHAIAPGAYANRLPPRVAVCLGHSLGEFSCLVASGALDLRSAANLVHSRGVLMDEHTRERWGRSPAMTAVLGLKWEDAIREITPNVPEGLCCECANENGAEQTVLAGCEDGVAWGVEFAKMNLGAKRGVRLQVSCPFHTSVMRSAAKEFEMVLDKVEIRTPAVPILFGLDGVVRNKPDDIKDALLRGMYSPVRWGLAVRNAAAEFGPCEFREVGPSPGTLRFGVSGVPSLVQGKVFGSTPDEVARAWD